MLSAKDWRLVDFADGCMTYSDLPNTYKTGIPRRYFLKNLNPFSYFRSNCLPSYE